MECVLTEPLYLDHAATTPMTTAAVDAVREGMAMWANPSSPHAAGRAARAPLEEARGRIAAAYGWSHEVLLTSGASESLAIALGRCTAARRIVSAVEHDAVLRAAGQAEVLAVDASGQVDAGALGDVAGALVAVQWCNSETGVKQDIAAIAAAVHDGGGLLLVDAAQMPAGPELAKLADFVAVSAHKRGGPPGTGALLVRDVATLHPSGGQERGYRAGTENLPGVLGHAAALGEAEPDHAARRARLDDAVRRSGGIVVAESAARHPAIGAYRMSGVGSAAQLIRFDMQGIAVSAGSACASGSLKPSHVLRAMGWSEEASREVVRVSFGRATTDADVERFVAAWRGVARATGRFAA
ncbi:aminotransferase class V-fold PLP-dependent enzyme [Sphingomonas sp. BE138]|uniref:cysteine desulfurase family protein n=1 Tax=Sphingomonas sp. BE138 TaxID=2817845 RepID=UPI00286BBEFB|nr:aminotransferase class V-fold PLP-dependent enzyme [Sphingomonas sp. BE138]